MKAFAGDSNIAAEIWRLHLKHSFSLVIETGTEFGHTALWLSNVAPVITIENNYDHYLKAVDLCEEARVCCVFGDSASVMRALAAVRVGGSTDNVLFYLDAHCQEDNTCPLAAELRAIGNLPCHPTIIIHDIQNPNNEALGYDSYFGKPLCLEMIQSHLDQIYEGSGYKYFYNTVAEGGLRGVIYITPKL